MNKEKYLWFTDTHLLPWKRHKLLNLILDNKPRAVFLTGDISYGPTLLNDLEYLGKKAGRPIYFVLGNHDYHFSSIDKVHAEVKFLCQRYSNLIWMTTQGAEPLTDDVALIGSEGWYDAQIGDPKYIQYTLDWPLIEDFKRLTSLHSKLELSRDLAKKSADDLVKKLLRAIENYKTVYLLTHVPPWPEANRDPGTFMEPFWLPYNINLTLGQELEKAMKNYKKRNLIVLSGHTHNPVQIHAARNIECIVGSPHFCFTNIFI